MRSTPFLLNIYYEDMQIGMVPPRFKCAGQFEIVDGDVEIEPRVTLVTLFGHTLGSQGVLVKTNQRRYLIAGDCIGTLDCWNGEDFSWSAQANVHVDL